MTRITWGDLRNPDFMQAIGKVFNTPMGFDAAQKFVLLGREFKKQQMMLFETHTKILNEFGTKEAKGNNYKIHDGKVAEFDAEMKKLEAHYFDVRVDKFDPKVLAAKMELSPQEWMFLAPILAEDTGAKVIDIKKPVEATPEQPSPGH